MTPSSESGDGPGGGSRGKNRGKGAEKPARPGKTPRLPCFWQCPPVYCGGMCGNVRRAGSTSLGWAAKSARNARKFKSGDTEDSFQYPLDGCTEDTEEKRNRSTTHRLLLTIHALPFPISHFPFPISPFPISEFLSRHAAGGATNGNAAHNAHGLVDMGQGLEGI